MGQNEAGLIDKLLGETVRYKLISDDKKNVITAVECL